MTHQPERLSRRLFRDRDRDRPSWDDDRANFVRSPVPRGTEMKLRCKMPVRLFVARLHGDVDARIAGSNEGRDLLYLGIRRIRLAVRLMR